MRTAIILFIFFITSCQSKKFDHDVELLSENQLIEVLSELQYMEALHRESEMAQSGKNALDTTSKIVLNAFNTDSLQVATTLDYYIRKPKKYKVIMEKVANKLLEKQNL